MPEQFEDGTGSGARARVSSANRLITQSVIEPISGERSRKAELWGVGTGTLSLGASTDGPVLWLRNDTTRPLFVHKLIFGWDGGTVSRNTTVFSLIFYNTPEPTANHTAIDAQIENIQFSGTDAPVTLTNFTAYKWDGNGTGMTVGAGGFAQIPNRLAIGNTSLPIDGEIVLGPGNSMQLNATPDEAGLYNVAVVFYQAPLDGIEFE